MEALLEKFVVNTEKSGS